jgi:hypothetical protein
MKYRHVAFYTHLPAMWKWLARRDRSVSSPPPAGRVSVHCDELVSLPKASLTDCVGRLSPQQMAALDDALRMALDLS